MARFGSWLPKRPPRRRSERSLVSFERGSYACSCAVACCPRSRREPRQLGGTAIARTLCSVRPPTGRHGTTRRWNRASPRRRVDGHGGSAEAPPTSPPRRLRPSCQHVRPGQEPAEARASVPVSAPAARRRRPLVLGARWKRPPPPQNAVAGWDESHRPRAPGATRKARRADSAPLREPHRLSRRARAERQVARRGRSVRTREATKRAIHKHPEEGRRLVQSHLGRAHEARSRHRCPAVP